MRYWPVNSCKECPRCDHKGAFAEIAYMPICLATGEILPYEVSAVRGRVYASATGVIPASCPLPVAPEQQSTQAGGAHARDL